MRLSVNLVSGNRYYRAGEEIPDGEVPVHAAKWAVDPDPDPQPIAPQRAPPSRLQRENRARKPSKGRSAVLMVGMGKYRAAEGEGRQVAFLYDTLWQPALRFLSSG